MPGSCHGLTAGKHNGGSRGVRGRGRHRGYRGIEENAAGGDQRLGQLVSHRLHAVGRDAVWAYCERTHNELECSGSYSEARVEEGAAQKRPKKSINDALRESFPLNNEASVRHTVVLPERRT